MSTAVDEATLAILSASGWTPTVDTIALRVLSTVYPVTSSGEHIPWMTILGRRDERLSFLDALAHRVQARVAWLASGVGEAKADAAWREAGYPVLEEIAQ